MATKKEVTPSKEEQFKAALELIAAGDAGAKYDLAIQIATKALGDNHD